MTPDDWLHIKDVLAEAQTRPRSERTAFLQQACGDDDALRDRVARLLQRDDRAVQRMKPPTASCDAGIERPPGTRIGRYEIRRVLGAGGMGTVYEAAQDNPRQLVALKVLRQGAVSRQAVARFRHEAEILGRLRHPNIAQVHEAGTLDDGSGARPFFAMELVKGEPLTVHAHESGLGIRKRLLLFAKVCDAVQFAHNKGVIHRDLKPDNILVDDFGEPKILDFGVARVTDSDIKATTLQTDIGQLIGTVPYMSPEQVTGDPADLDTRTDVYSLGVVLYEMLSGRLPHDISEKSIPEAIRVIRDEEPTPLSSVNRIFRGDVDTIVARALEKEKDRRYQTPAELAADVRHFLKDEPIVARPASTFYQLRKFARRNRALVGGVAAVFVVMAAGATVSTLLAIGQTRAKNEAILEARKATEISEYFMLVLSLINPNEEGGTSPTPAGLHNRATSLTGLLDLAGEQIDSALADWPLKRAELHVRFGHTYQGLLDMAKASSHFERAYELRKNHLGKDHRETFVTLVLWARTHRGRHDKTDKMFQEAADGLARVAGREHLDTLEARAQLGHHIGFRRRRFVEGEEILRETLAARQEILGNKDPATITNARYLVKVLIKAQRFADADELASDWLAVSQEHLGDDHMRTVDLNNGLGEIRLYTGRASEAERFFRKAFDSVTRRVAFPTARASEKAMRLGQALNALDRHDDAERVIRDVADATRAELGDNNTTTWFAHYRLGVILNGQGKLRDAAQIITEAVDNCRRIQGKETWLSLQMSYKLGSVLRNDRRFDEARASLQWTLDQQRELHGPGTIEVLITLNELASLALAQRDFDEAERLLRESFTGRDRLLGADHLATLAAASRLGWFLRDRGPTEAVALLTDTVERQRETLGKDNSSLHHTMARLGVVMEKQGEPEAAEKWLRQAYEGRRRVLGETHSSTLWSMQALADVLSNVGKLDDAETLYRRVLECRRNKLGDTHRNTLDAINVLAWFLKDLEEPEKLVEAESLARDTTSLARSTYGPDDELTIMLADTLAVVLGLRGNCEAALVEFEQAAAAARDSAGEEPWCAAMSCAAYGRCLITLEHFEDAQDVLLAAYDAADESAREALIDLYNAWGKPETAAEYRDQE